MLSGLTGCVVNRIQAERVSDMWTLKMLLRRLLLFCALSLCALSFCSCSSVLKSRDAYDACRSDPQCLAQMDKGRDLVSSIVLAAASAVPQSAPFAPFAAQGCGVIASILIGVHLGRKQVK